MTPIKVVGHDASFDLEEVKDAVVKIRTLYYFKHDEKHVIRVKNEEGKNRYYTKKSPFVVQLPQGNFIHKSQAIQTEDGIYLERDSPDVVTIDGKFYRKSYIVKVENRNYLITDPLLVKDGFTGAYLLKSTATMLSPELYGKELYTHTKHVLEITGPGDKKYLIHHKDKMELFSVEANQLIFTHEKLLIDRTMNVTVDFQDKTNPQEDRLLARPIYRSLMDAHTIEFILTPEVVARIPRGLQEYFQNVKEKFIMPRYETRLESIRKKINDNYSDLDKYENVAKDFSHVAKPFPGKSRIAISQEYGRVITSDTFELTGGLEYSFGVEFESSEGLLSNQSIINALKLNVVGDRSIGAGEYVTSPAVGDAGVNNLEEICRMLNKSVLVDDRCGLHVHVGWGGTPFKKLKFDRSFLINSIRLGALIEEELYKSLPPSREPTLYHCHSIKRYAEINENNYDNFMGAYIFGPKEYWLSPTSQCPQPMFKFADYALNSRRNTSNPVGQWQDGRYKWLNLINAFSSQAPHKTIEFRIFPGTTRFAKTYAYLLTCLAFVYVVDNCPKLIAEGVKLRDLFQAAYGKKAPELVDKLDEFYAKRTTKFNRKNIYPKIKLSY